MALRLIVAPAESPVSLEQAKAHLRVIHDDDDGMIQIYLDAAVSHLDGRQGQLGRALVTQTWELVYDDFPCGPIQIPLPPLKSITSVKYYDTAGVKQTLAASDYSVDTASDPGWLAPVSSWPSTYDMVNAVEIRFVAGYGAAAEVPAALRAAILLMVSDLHENREANIVGTIVAANPTVDRLLYPFRRITP